MKRILCRFFHRQHHFADYQGRHLVTKNGSFRCMGCRKCGNGWYEKSPSMRLPCVLFGHRFYQGVAGHCADGTPYPGKFCYDCDYSEDLS